MRLMKASNLPQKRVHDFLESNQQVNQAYITQSGYLIEMNHDICGCFVLEHIKDGLYVLRHFFLTVTDALKIPILVEAILQLATEKKATKVFVHSHKLMVDMILEALQFRPQENSDFLDKYSQYDGKWWSYTISN